MSYRYDLHAGGGSDGTLAMSGYWGLGKPGVSNSLRHVRLTATMKGGKP